MPTGWTSGGSFKSTEKWLQELSDLKALDRLEHFGAKGVAALQRATPVDEGETAASWGYEIIRDATSWSIVWGNSHMAGPTPIAVLLQLGHGTGTGGWVEGRDYINPALRPILDEMVNEGWKVVSGA